MRSLRLRSGSSMADREGIVIPRETVNDDLVRIVKWEVETGAQVKKGDPLLEVETSKAVLAVAAEHDGFVEIFQHAGDEVEVGAEVGAILCSRPAMMNVGPSATSTATVESGEVDASEKRVSRKAQQLIDKHEVDLAVFEGLQIIREADVLRYIESGSQMPADETDEVASSAPTGSTVAPPPEILEEVLKAKAAVGPTAPSRALSLWEEARAAARDRGISVLGLVWNYGFRAYFLGFLARIAPYGVIVHVHRWRGVKIGRGCFVDQTAVLETAYADNITIGDDVRVTANAVVMTHIKASLYLRESGLVPRTIRPVVLEDHCFIGVGALIMPGVTVGKASVVASGAVVVNNVPPFSMVAGNPATVVKRFPVA